MAITKTNINEVTNKPNLYNLNLVVSLGAIS